MGKRAGISAVQPARKTQTTPTQPKPKREVNGPRARKEKGGRHRRLAGLLAFSPSGAFFPVSCVVADCDCLLALSLAPWSKNRETLNHHNKKRLRGLGWAQDWAGQTKKVHFSQTCVWHKQGMRAEETIARQRYRLRCLISSTGQTFCEIPGQSLSHGAMSHEP